MIEPISVAEQILDGQDRGANTGWRRTGTGFLDNAPASASRGPKRHIMLMKRSSFLRLAVVAVVAFWLAGCGRSESFRYKLTLAVNTPDGVRKASSVVEVTFWDVSFPAKGTMHKLRGEALYLDLGVSNRPLIALLTHRLHLKYGTAIRWGSEAGPDVSWLDKLYGAVPSQDFLDDVPRIAAMRGPHKIIPEDLPDLVTFTDPKDPSTVIEVNPNNLQATVGAGISWNEITLECSDQPITRSIEQKLPWLHEYFEKNLRLDGADHGAKQELANILSWPDFEQSDDLKRTK
jgi:hypothetical protein